MVVVFVAVAGIFVSITIVRHLHGAKGPPALFGLVPLAVLAIIVLRFLSLPYRITLSSDGTVEFISLLRRRTVRAEEIRSIRPQGTQFGFFVVQTDQGKITILAQFDGFHDFLSRLEALHPGVELRGC